MANTQNVSIKKIGLGKESDFALFQLIVDYSNKSYVKDVFVQYKDETIAANYRESVEFFSILDSLVKKGLAPGDENGFFKYAQKSTKSNQLFRSLQLKHDLKVYISPATAKTMCQFYNESKIGLSFRTVLMSETVFSIETTLSTTRQDAKFPSDEDLEDVIEEVMKDNGIKYDNTPYYSQRITKLLHAIKYKKSSDNNLN